MNSLRFNLAKEGLETLFTPYQCRTLELLWSSSTRKRLSSLEIMKFLHSAQINLPVSRSAIIQFLNKMTEESFIDFTVNTGKGGVHKLYKLTGEGTEKDFRKKLYARINQHALKHISLQDPQGKGVSGWLRRK